MKKKLIAAILSVALVASLVPATAFATSDSSADVKSNIVQKQNVASARAATAVAHQDWTDANPAGKIALSGDKILVTGTLPYNSAEGKADTNEVKVTISPDSWLSTATHYTLTPAGGSETTPRTAKASSEDVTVTVEKGKTTTIALKAYSADTGGSEVTGESKTITVDATGATFQTEAEAKKLQKVTMASTMAISKDPAEGATDYSGYLNPKTLAYANTVSTPIVAADNSFSLTGVMVSGKVIPANGKLELTVTKPTAVRNFASKEVTLTTQKWSIGNATLQESTVANQKVLITNTTKYITLNVEGYDPVKIDIEGLDFLTGNADFDTLVDKVNTDFASPIAQPTYNDFVTYDKINKQISELSAGDTEEFEKRTGTNYTTNFKNAYTAAAGFKATVDSAKTAIAQISSGALTKSSEGAVNAAEKAVKKVEDLQNDVSYNKLGTVKGTGLTASDVIGTTNMTALNNAKIIIKAVLAIENMEAVNNTTFENYQTRPNTIAATKAITAAKVAGVDSRIGNMTTYTKKIKDANNAGTLVNEATVAIAAAKNYANTLKAPYTQAQLDKLTTLEKAAKATLEALPTGVTISTSVADMKTVEDKITAIEESMENEKIVGPLIALIQKLPKATDLAWANKDDMFKMSRAYSELSNDEQTYLKDNYPVELAKLTALEAAQPSVENKNQQAAIDRMTAQINGLPAISLENEDAINEVIAAFQQYETGYLRSVPVISNLSSAVKAKYDAAVSGLKVLTDARDKEDKVVVQKFAALMTPLKTKLNGNTLTLSDKALVQEARAAYDKLTDSQKKLAKDDFKELEKMEKKIADLEEGVDINALANQVKVAIRALPATDKITIADKDAVYAANELYLSAIAKDSDVKGLVDNREDLFVAVGKVMDLEIAALPTLKGDGTDTIEEIKAAAEKINAAKATYDKIGKEQQTYVTKNGDLDKAVAALSAAKVKHTDAQLTEIAKIDFTKELTAEQISLIKDEKACIEALSDAEKAKLNADNLKIFTDTALKALEAQENAGKTIDKIEGLKNVVYTGKAQTPAIKVMGKDGKEIAADNYTVKYYSNKNVGEATVLVKAKADSGFTGEAEATFIITPAKASITSLQVAKAKLRVNIKPMSGVNYRIAYKLTSAKSYKGQNTSLTSKVLPGIKAKKKYTVKVRAYIKEGGKTYFGAYSPIKHATTK